MKNRTKSFFKNYSMICALSAATLYPALDLSAGNSGWFGDVQENAWTMSKAVLTKAGKTIQEFGATAWENPERAFDVAVGTYAASAALSALKVPMAEPLYKGVSAIASAASVVDSKFMPIATTALMGWYLGPLLTSVLAYKGIKVLGRYNEADKLYLNDLQSKNQQDERSIADKAKLLMTSLVFRDADETAKKGTPILKSDNNVQ